MLGPQEQNTVMNVIFSSRDLLSGRNDVTSDKVNFRPGIRQNFFSEKNYDIESLCLLEFVINIKLR